MNETPTQPLVPVIGPGGGLPEDARRLLERGRIPFVDACRFIGVDRTLGYTLARRYIKRTAKMVSDGRPFNSTDLKPKRDKDGRWQEMPCYQVGHKYLCRADLLVQMIYPEARP